MNQEELENDFKLRIGSNFIQEIPDSQFYTNLEQVLHSLEIMRVHYQPKEKPPNSHYIQYPPIDFKYLMKGLENSIRQGYDLKK